MIFSRLRSTACLIFFCFGGISHAYADGGFLGLSLGTYNVFDVKDKPAVAGIEYRPDSNIFLKRLKPWLGLNITHNASIWAGGGVLLDLPTWHNFYMTPSIGVGVYRHGHSDKDLDSVLEFRSQIELGYEFKSGSRLGLGLSHISNGGLFGRRNPGTEMITLQYHIPLSKILP